MNINPEMKQNCIENEKQSQKRYTKAPKNGNVYKNKQTLFKNAQKNTEN